MRLGLCNKVRRPALHTPPPPGATWRCAVVLCALPALAGTLTARGRPRGKGLGTRASHGIPSGRRSHLSSRPHFLPPPTSILHSGQSVKRPLRSTPFGEGVPQGSGCRVAGRKQSPGGVGLTVGKPPPLNIQRRVICI